MGTLAPFGFSSAPPSNQLPPPVTGGEAPDSIGRVWGVWFLWVRSPARTARGAELTARAAAAQASKSSAIYRPEAGNAEPAGLLAGLRTRALRKDSPAAGT